MRAVAIASPRFAPAGVSAVLTSTYAVRRWREASALGDFVWVGAAGSAAATLDNITIEMAAKSEGTNERE
jgi:hypothetical protein